MKLKCLAIDDEPFALKQIAGYIEKTPFLDLGAQCSNAIEAMQRIEEQQFDLVFVDINMPEMSGMEFVKAQNSQMNIIFTTAYSEYAVESYKVDAIDYLLKPITYEDFLRAVNKARDFIENKRSHEKQGEEDVTHFFVKSEGKTIRIDIDQIEFIESLSEYVKIHLLDQSYVMTLMSLKNLTTALPTDKFMRVHRSFIVNLERITTIQRNRIVFSDKNYVPVSDQYKDEFKKFVDRNFL